MADITMEKPVHKPSRARKYALWLGLPAAGAAVVTGTLALKLFTEDVGRGTKTIEPKTEQALREKPRTIDLSEALDVPAPKKYALDHSGFDSFMTSFAEALEAGKRDVYAEGTPKRYLDYFRGFEGVDIVEIKKLPKRSYWTRGYKIFYEDGRSMVFNITVLNNGKYHIRYMLPAD